MKYTSEQLANWNRVVDILREDMATPTFNAWIKPLQLDLVTSDEVAVKCADAAVQTMLTQRYSQKMNAAVRSAFGPHYTLKLLPADE